MSEQLGGESTAQDEQAEVIARPSVSAGHFWINLHRTGSDLLGGSFTKHRQRVNLKRGLWLRQRLARTSLQARGR